ncbi:MAG TPA: putative metallopeptidase [Bacillota bacterium]|nr:putative metallopeptidase [Bacillota bacterium]
MGKEKKKKDLPSTICKDCANKDACITHCEALERLYKLMKVIDYEEKTKLLQEYKKDLELIFAEPDPETEEIANKIIDRYPEFDFIKSMDIKIGFICSYETKMKDGKATLGTCEKVSEKYKAYLPYDYIITIYKSNAYYLNNNQYKLLIYHELKHITVGMRGLAVRPHDIEDFADILRDFGLDWNGVDSYVPDILA